MINPPNPRDVDVIVSRALEEDLTDITAEAIFDPADRGRGEFLIKAGAVLAGLPFAEAVFRRLDPSCSFTELIPDGSQVQPGDLAARVEASVIALLSGERPALNLMQRASGIATTTATYVEQIAGTGARIYDTRKTAPGLRALDKYAVRAGGGENHRLGLHDMFLIKNNHIDRAGSVGAAIAAVQRSGRSEKVMVEVRNLEELQEALEKEPDYILLDNMSLDGMREAVRITAGRSILEASGGITMETLRPIAETGVDRISIGALTHSVRALDISFRISRA